ncbi:MAG: 3-deoxy-manno-octulosonate cytidylyltransferase, partial [Bacteroidales bacterium]|nr:3-deoxy-manno-octulosonate cytidylyltransferase [Bacteroidales bacterium]
MKVLAVIPARYESTRFPGKPLVMLGGKPLIQWVWDGVR